MKINYSTLKKWNIITILLVLFAGYWNVQMDYCQFQDNSCREDWREKWALDEQGQIIPNDVAPWYYLRLYAPKYVERFPYSSTALVAFTDRWHKYQSFFFTCLFLAMVFYRRANKWWGHLAWFIGLRVAFTIIFELLYKRKTTKKK